VEFLFGEGQYGLRFLFAFIVVLALIGLTAWLVRRFGAERLGAASARGRQPRLALIDQAAVDSRRRLILIRRDNVEHLLMIGGPSDVVVEANIVRAAVATATPRPPAAADTLSRAVTLGDGAWPLQPEPVPPSPAAPPLPPRPHRSPPPPQLAAENGHWHAEPEPPPPPARPHRAPPSPPQAAAENGQWQGEPEPPPPPARPNRVVDPPNRVGDPLAGLAAELSRNPPPEPAAPAPPPRAPRERLREAAREAPRETPHEPAPVRQPQPTNGSADPQYNSAADQNLAEMAQRLEAALRRPAGRAEARTEPKARPTPQPAPQPALQPIVHPAVQAATLPAPQPVPQPTPDVEFEPAPAAAEAGPPQAETKPARETKAAAPGRSLYDSLEQEMASLLGRPNRA